MRRIAVCLSLAVVMSVFCVSLASAVTLNFSVTFDETTFRDCEEPFCQLLTRIYECHSRDIENVAAHYSSDEAHVININVNVNHSSSWFSWLKKLWPKPLNKKKKQNAQVSAVTQTVVPSEQKLEPQPKPDSAPKFPELLELVNRKDYSWLKEFYDAGALESVDCVYNIPKEEYFNEKRMTFCVLPLSSTPKYGFVDRDKLLDYLKSLYDRGFDTNGARSFSFRLSSDKEINLKAEEFLLLKESLRPVKADKQPKDPGESFGLTRYFFKTDHEGVYLVVVPKDSKQRIRFFLATDKSVIDVSKLNDALDKNIKQDSQKVTFKLLTPVDMMERRNFENYLDIFIRQVLDKSVVIETVR